MIVSSAVEGSVDGAVARRLILFSGGIPGPVYGHKGKHYLRDKIAGYSRAAQLSPWLVLTDLDHDADCAPSLRRTWLSQSSPHLCFRIAVREVEAWLLADGKHMAEFLKVPMSQVPQCPDLLDDPKRVIVDLARSSQSREMREDMVPK